MPAVTIERSTDDAVLIMTWHDFYVVWLDGPMTVENQRESEAFGRKLMERWPRGVGMLVVINEAARAPTPEVRKELNEIYRRITPNLRGVSYAILGSGMSVQLAKATLIGMNLLARRPYRSSVTSDLRNAAKWLFYTLGEDPERGTVDQFLQALKSAVQGESPQTLRTQKR